MTRFPKRLVKGCSMAGRTTHYDLRLPEFVVVARDKDGGPWQVVSIAYETEVEAFARLSETKVFSGGLYRAVLTVEECEAMAIE